jgi:hypothetical protein
MRIGELLASFPEGRETKVEKLLRGLGALWEQNPNEKVVIFATYLATVDLLSREINAAYPGQGVVELRGGDHGAKLAAEKRFRRSDGPRVMVCTAAGREGINLQFARILFNFDLPWNPMDVEQRIGRIHRYGQRDTAQVYNLVLSDTIEGRIFLLLSDKLLEIARALGKVDEHGNVTEDLKAQILGQLSDRLTYDTLYRDALSDPELKRTRQELEAAVSNANEARKVVFELFQDLDRFSLDDYQPFANIDASKQRILGFLRAALEADRGSVEPVGADCFRVTFPEQAEPLVFTLDREVAQRDERIQLMGLDHPLMVRFLKRWCLQQPEQLGIATAATNGTSRGVLTVWSVEAFGGTSSSTHVIPIAVDLSGQRIPGLEKRYSEAFAGAPLESRLDVVARKQLYRDFVEPALRRELGHRGLAGPSGGHSTELIAWVEVG